MNNEWGMHAVIEKIEPTQEQLDEKIKWLKDEYIKITGDTECTNIDYIGYRPFNKDASIHLSGEAKTDACVFIRFK